MYDIYIYMEPLITGTALPSKMSASWFNIQPNNVATSCPSSE